MHCSCLLSYKISDIGLKDYYPNTDLIGFHYTLAQQSDSTSVQNT